MKIAKLILKTLNLQINWTKSKKTTKMQLEIKEVIVWNLLSLYTIRWTTMSMKIQVFQMNWKQEELDSWKKQTGMTSFLLTNWDYLICGQFFQWWQILLRFWVVSIPSSEITWICQQQIAIWVLVVCWHGGPC